MRSAAQQKNHIAGQEEEKRKRLKMIDDEIQLLTDRGTNPTRLEWLKEHRSQVEAAYDRIITRAKEDLDQATITEDNQLSAQIAREAEIASRAEHSLKVKARGEYIRAGGDPEKFEADWPALHQEIMAKQVATNVQVAKPNVHL